VKRSKHLVYSTGKVSFWLILLLMVSLTLAACERTIPRDDEPADAPLVVDNSTPPEDIFTPVLPPPDAEPGDAYPPPEDVTEPPAEEPGDPPETEEPSEPDTPAPTTPLEPGGTYTVQPGDTLFAIAQRYGVTVEALAQANNITNVHRLEVGQVLTIPGEGDEPPPAVDPGEERIHVVQRGENLYRIGLQYGFTVEELASYNNIADPTRIDVGQQIRIPPR
jgi:LysM repeat protein